MPSPGVSLDNAISGLTVGIEQARRVAGQLSSSSKAPEPEGSGSVEVSDFEPGETVGTNIDVTA